MEPTYRFLQVVLTMTPGSSVTSNFVRCCVPPRLILPFQMEECSAKKERPSPKRAPLERGRPFISDAFHIFSSVMIKSKPQQRQKTVMLKSLIIIFKRQRTITIANGLPVAYGINRLDSHFRSVSEIPE